MLIWVSVMVFLTGYTIWEVLEYSEVAAVDRKENREFTHVREMDKP